MFRGGFKLFTILGDRCRECPGLALTLQRFWVLWGEFGNRCEECPSFGPSAAVIPDFRGSTWESLQGNALLRQLMCIDSRFQGVNLAITASFSPLTPSFVHRFLISGPNLRIAAASRRCKEEWPACSDLSDDDVRVRF